MISLDQDSIVKPKPMVASTAHAHRVLLQAPEPRGGFTGVEEFRAGSRQLVL